MKKIYIFIAVTLLQMFTLSLSLVWPQTDNTHNTQKATARFEIVKPFPEVPDKLMVYKTVKPNISVESVKQFMSSCNIKGKIEDHEVHYIVKEDQLILDVYTEKGTGYIRFSNNRELGKEKKADNLPAEETAIKKAESFLKKDFQLPAHSVLAGMGYNEFHSFDSKGNLVEKGRTGIVIGFKFFLNELPVQGPGAKAGVVFGEDGKIIGASKIWRETKPFKKRRIKTPQEAFEEFKKLWPEEANSKVINDGLIFTDVFIRDCYPAYYAEPGRLEQPYINPFYFFKGDFIIYEIKNGQKKPKEKDVFEIKIPAIPEEL